MPGTRVSAGWRSATAEGIVYRPTVTFTTLEGQEVTATSVLGANPRPGKVGDVVPVIYDPRDPQRIRVKTGGASSCVPIVFVVLGAVLCAFGLYLVVSAG